MEARVDLLAAAFAGRCLAGEYVVVCSFGEIRFDVACVLLLLSLFWLALVLLFCRFPFGNGRCLQWRSDHFLHSALSWFAPVLFLCMSVWRWALFAVVIGAPFGR